MSVLFWIIIAAVAILAVIVAIANSSSGADETRSLDESRFSSDNPYANGSGCNNEVYDRYDAARYEERSRRARR